VGECGLQTLLLKVHTHIQTFSTGCFACVRSEKLHTFCDSAYFFLNVIETMSDDLQRPQVNITETVIHFASEREKQGTSHFQSFGFSFHEAHKIHSYPFSSQLKKCFGDY
jgi:hypothetical protein